MSFIKLYLKAKYLFTENIQKKTIDKSEKIDIILVVSKD